MKRKLICFICLISFVLNINFSVYAESVDVLSSLMTAKVDSSWTLEDGSSYDAIDTYSVTGITIGSILLFLLGACTVGGISASGMNVGTFDFANLNVTYNEYQLEQLRRINSTSLLNFYGIPELVIESLVARVQLTGFLTASDIDLLYPVIQDYYPKVFKTVSVFDTSECVKGTVYSSTGTVLSADLVQYAKTFGCFAYDVTAEKFKTAVGLASSQGYKYIHFLSGGYISSLTSTESSLVEFSSRHKFFVFFTRTADYSFTLQPVNVISKVSNAGWGVSLTGDMLIYNSFVLKDKSFGAYLVDVSRVGFYHGVSYENLKYMWPDIEKNKMYVSQAFALLGDAKTVSIAPSLPITYPNADQALKVVAPVGALGNTWLGDIAKENVGALGGTTIEDEVPVAPPITGDLSLDGVISGLGAINDTLTGGLTLDLENTLEVSKSETLDFTPLMALGENITNKFPFSLPWDLMSLLSIFDAPPKAPNFEVNFMGQDITVLDLRPYESAVKIFRFFILLYFIAGLIKITGTLTKH